MEPVEEGSKREMELCEDVDVVGSPGAYRSKSSLSISSKGKGTVRRTASASPEKAPHSPPRGLLRSIAHEGGDYVIAGENTRTGGAHTSLSTGSTAETGIRKGTTSPWPRNDQRLHPHGFGRGIEHKERPHMSVDGKTTSQITSKASFTGLEADTKPDDQTHNILRQDRPSTSQKPDQGIDLERDTIINTIEKGVVSGLDMSGVQSSKADGTDYERTSPFTPGQTQHPQSRDIVEETNNHDEKSVNAAHEPRISTREGFVNTIIEGSEVDLERTIPASQDSGEEIEYDAEEVTNDVPNTRCGGDTTDISTILREGEVKSKWSGTPLKHTKPASSLEERRSSSALFVSSRESSIRSESPSTHTAGISGVAGFGVVLSPVKREWEYQTYDFDPTVRSVVRKLSGSGDSKYLVTNQDGRNTVVSFDQLLQLPGGARAFRKSQDPQTEKSDDSVSSDIESDMVATRSMLLKKALRSNSAKLSRNNPSEDELGVETDSTRPSRRRRLVSRRLLSSPRPPSSRTSPNNESLVETDSFVDESDSAAPTRRTRSHYAKAAQKTTNEDSIYFEGLSEDDTESLQSFDSYTGLGKRKRAKKGKKGSRAQSHDPRATRRSERTGRNTTSMREPGLYDIPDTGPDTDSYTSAKHDRVVRAKETFRRLPADDEFALRHCLTCTTCKDFGDSDEKGSLVYCQGCTSSYHQVCLGTFSGRQHVVTKVGEDNFVLQCRRCVDYARKREPTAPRQGCCQVCHEQGASCSRFVPSKSASAEPRENEDLSGAGKTTAVSPELVNNAKNVLFRCTRCFQAFHMHHLPPLSETVSADDSDEQQTGSDRFVEYCKDWLCYDCNNAPAEVDALVAWRPVDVDNYVLYESTEQVNEEDKEYLVKWKDLSYFHVSWKSGSWVWGITSRAMRKAFARRNNQFNLPKMSTEDAVPEDFLRVDIVFEVKYKNQTKTSREMIDSSRVKDVEEARVKFKGLGYEDVVWEQPPDPEDGERWTDWEEAYIDFVNGHYIRLPNPLVLKSHLMEVKSQDFESEIMMKEQPKSLTGGKLMKYQIEGLNWLLYHWFVGQNAILADEMGLGKTIQIIGFLTTLQQVHQCWPFLVVVPNATCANWRREIKQWAPSLRVVTYFGSAEAKRLALEYEMFPLGAKELACHVVVTSYEAAQDENVIAVLKRISWAGLIVDEGQRLKNDKTILYNALTALKAPFKVLLTGTPLQNNQRELFNLLQFLDKSVNAQALEEKYATLTKESVAELHDLLRPFFLRRTKAQVLDFLPAMAQIIVPVTPSVLQKQLYKSILTKNPEMLKFIVGGHKRSAVTRLMNLVMQLRKCLCHPFVYSSAIEERTADPIESHRRLVEASSKLQLLEIMLPKLKERGHRVLMFSQFLEMITIVEDFLDGLGLTHRRLDGSMNSLQKQKCIDEFNTPDSPLFALLLSTRAGGVGINLATADTVIILDPDFNPHRDIQAISRAHRIGQTKKVLVYQLMTRGTAEEKIMQIGKKKMALDHVLIEKMETDDLDNNDLESVLRYGAEALFADDNTHDIHYDSASVDKLLDRSQVEDTKTGSDASAESQFSFARVWANETGTMEDKLGPSSEDENATPDPTLWEKILEERRVQAEKDGASRIQTFGRGKRQRQAVDYANQTMNGVDISPFKKHKGDTDDEFQARPESEVEESADEMIEDDNIIASNYGQQITHAMHPPGSSNSAPGMPVGQQPPQGSTYPPRFSVGQPYSSNVAYPSVNYRGQQHPQTSVLPASASQVKQLPQSVVSRKQVPVSKPKVPGEDTFRRARVTEPPPEDRVGNLPPCIACKNSYGSHKVGCCPLKLAGVECCNLCGLAHYSPEGQRKAICPSLQSEDQVQRMLDQLKESTESDELIRQATVYMLKLKQGFANKRKRQAEKQARQAQGSQKGQLSTPHPNVLTATYPGTAPKGNGDDEQAKGGHKPEQRVDALMVSQPVARPVNINLQGTITLGEPYEVIDLDGPSA